MTASPIETLCSDLCAEFERDPAAPGAVALLESYARDHDDWRTFAFFSDEHYTRNLIHSDATFELMIVCWSPGQESPIHNHAGSDCWMGVLDGRVEELHYKFPSGNGTLEPTRSKTCEPGSVAFIRDEIALHLVRPVGAGPAASLHLYSSPIPSCQVYCPETGKVADREMSFHSIKGALVSAT